MSVPDRLDSAWAQFTDERSRSNYLWGKFWALQAQILGVVLGIDDYDRELITRVAARRVVGFIEAENPHLSRDQIVAECQEAIFNSLRKYQSGADRLEFHNETGEPFEKPGEPTDADLVEMDIVEAVEEVLIRDKLSELFFAIAGPTIVGPKRRLSFECWQAFLHKTTRKVTEAYLKVLGLHANNPDVDILRARLAESIPEEFMWKWHHLVKHVDLDPGPILAAEVGNLPRKFTDFELLMGIDANTYTYIDAAVGQITQEVMAGSAQPGVALEQASESAAEARTAPDQPAPQSRIAFDDRILPRLARRAEDIVDLIFLTAAEDDDGRLHLSCAEWQPILSRHVQGMIEWAEQELSDISADAPDDFFYFLRSKIAVTARNECRRIWDDLTANVELEKDPLGMDTQLLVDSAATALAQKIASMARPKPEMADGVNVAREAIHGLLKLAVVSPAGRRREAGAKARQGEAGGPVSEARTESWAERMAAFIEKVSTIEDPIIQSDVHSALRHKTAKTWQNLKNGVGTTQAARDYSRLFAMSRDEFIALRRQLS